MKNMYKNELSLSYLFPDIAQEWDPDKNGKLTPNDVVPGSAKRIWWKCSKGHEWVTKIEHRTRSKSGCPYCAGQKATNENCLEAIHPEVSKLWHPTKNRDLTPRDVMPKTNKKVWWQCTKGHEWEAPPSRLSSGGSCPYCKNSSVHKENSLGYCFPDIAHDWQIVKNGELTPSDVVAGSAKKVWWKCSKGHEWEAPIRRRTNQNSGCPYCANLIVSKDNSLAVRFPEIAKAWDYEKNDGKTPDDYVGTSNKKVWWNCNRGHSWIAAIQQRTVAKTGCPLCRPNISRLELRIFAEFLSLFSDVSRQQKIWGKEFDISIPSLSVCIEIDGYPWHLEKKEKDFQKNLLCEANGYLLLRVRDKRLGVLGENNIFYQEKDRDNNLFLIQNLVKMILVKSSLSEKQMIKVENYLSLENYKNDGLYQQLISELPGPGYDKSLTVTHPKIAAQWHPTKNGKITPDMVSVGSGLNIWWQCSNAHEWQSYLYTRTKAGCPFCSNRRVTPENSLARLYPEIAKQWHPTKNGKLTANDVVAGSGKKAWWQCSIGHEWLREIEKRTKGKRGCPYCAGRLLPKESRVDSV